MSRSLRRRSQRAVKSHRNTFEAPNIVEKLEQKQLLVGQVQAVVRGGNLYITGEESANQVDISFHEGNVAVRPKQGTRINGTRGQFVAFENTDTVPGSIFINMKQGDDTVILSSGLKVQKDVLVNGKQGNDTLGLNNAIIRDDLIYYGGTGDDSISLEDSRVVDVLKIKMNAGDDLVRIVNSEVKGNARVRGATGVDSIVLDGASFRRHVQIHLHQGDDIVDIQNSHADGRFRIKAGRGDDVALIDDSTFEYTTVIHMGAGDDNFTLGEEDGQDDTPASGNVFKRAFVAIGGSGTDAINVDIDNEFRSARREGRFEGIDFAGSTAGAISAADDVATAIQNFIDVELTGRVVAASNDLVFGTGVERVVATEADTVTIDGTTDAGATIEFDTDGDGVFDNLTTTADNDGNYSAEVPLLVDSLHTIDIRNADQTGETQQVQVQHIVGTIVRMETSLGNIDVELLDNEVSDTVDNFLGYFDRYGDNTIVHRSPEDFVIQAGGFTVDGETISSISTDANITGEFDPDRSNVAGTLSMALSNGADTGNSQWFVNVADNSRLDADFHTVFGILIGFDQGPSFDVANAINDLEIFDITEVNSALSETPLQDFTETTDLTGTVSIADGSVSVFGTGTRFTSELEINDRFTVGTQIFIVNTIAGDDELTVTTSAQEQFTAATATVENTPSEDNYVVFSDFTLLDELAEL